MQSNAKTCWGCRHFIITHEANRPYACAAMGFKSKLLPCFEVVRVEGSHCYSFSSKEAQHKALGKTLPI